MTDTHFTIGNAQLVLPGESEPITGWMAVESDRIAEVGRGAGSSEPDIDARGMILAPGIIDAGVFAIDKPAFRFGGITRAALMPDQSPVHDDPATIRFAAREGKPDFWVHPLAAATRGLRHEEMAELALMKDAGAVAIATGRRWIADSGLMLQLMRYAAMLDMALIVHPEDGSLTGDAVATDGETATRLGLKSAPAMAEALAVARDIALARESGVRLHFRQVTTAAALDHIRAAKAEGLSVSCGITPAHLFLNDQAVSDFRTFARISPPLRDEDDRQACLDAVADGTIDLIHSGHDPRGAEDKRLPFADAAEGAAGAETLLPLALNLVRDGRIDMGRLFELLSGHPAKLLGLDAGKLEAGLAADFIMIEPDAPWQVDAKKMAGQAGNTPFDRLPVQGRVRRWFKGGREFA